MPQKKEKKYPGVSTYNRNLHKDMHMVAPYTTYYGRKEGVYSDAYDDLVIRLAKRTKADMQNVIIVEGETGSGKSSLALNLCVDLARKMGKTFDLQRDYIYSATDMWKKLADPNASPITLIDEGTITIASNNAMRGDDKQMASLFDTMRSRGWTTFICTPSFHRINSTIRKDHATFKLRCTPKNDPLIPGYGRGFFECRRAVRSEFRNEDPIWMLMYAGIFGDYPPSLKDEYLQIKKERQDELMEKYVKKSQIEDAKEEKRFQTYVAWKPDPDGEW